MRETLADPALARRAGRFVWLELDFDKPENQGFIARHDVTYTPSLYVLDPTDERAAAAHFGGMTLPELNRFLDQGERVVEGRAGTPAAALARGDALLGSGRPGHAAAAYRAAIQQLMHAAQSHGDADTAARWGGRWLDEIEATVPASDDERTALDIARVDAVSILGTPARALPVLEASERAMPGNYNASLRLAQVAMAAHRYDEALAACARGLAHVTGPIGRTWFLETKAEVLVGKGEAAAAHRVLEEALRSARAIGARRVRDRNIHRITQAMAETASVAE